MKRKIVINILTFLLLVVALTTSTYAYVGTIYRSNNEQIELGELDHISVELFILADEGFKLIPFGANPTKANEVDEVLLKIVVTSDIPMLYKLKHNIPIEYELVDFFDWRVYEISNNPNEHTFKLRLLENLDSLTLNFNFEIYSIEVLK